MSILATAVTTIECDGHHGSACPDNAVVKFNYPKSVAIRLAKQSGWTVWMESTCPACSAVGITPGIQLPAAPAVLEVPVGFKPRPAGLLVGSDRRESVTA